MPDQDMEQMATSSSIGMSTEDFKFFQEDLHYILADRTSGEARTEVDAESQDQDSRRS